MDSDEEECLAFGYLRGIRDQALSLEFRFANGNREAFPYSWLGPATYNPSAGLLLKFVGDLIYLVLLEGSNLNALVNGAVSLYDRGIQRHRDHLGAGDDAPAGPASRRWRGDDRAYPRPLAPAGRGAARRRVAGGCQGPYRRLRRWRWPKNHNGLTGSGNKTLIIGMYNEHAKSSIISLSLENDYERSHTTEE